MTHSFSHLGICVSDLERSVRFYCEGLGFEPVAIPPGRRAEFAALMEVRGGPAGVPHAVAVTG